jgi:hypothetical protein
VDALKLIPQLFYDLIARVLPGSVALVLLGLSTDLKLGKWITDFWEGATAIQGSALWLGFGFLVAAYLVGNIISPISDFLENRLVKRLFSDYFEVLRFGLSTEGIYSPDMRKALLRELGAETNHAISQITSIQYRKAVFVWYDWLRVNSPQAGANAAKIRAEYRMHSQNTVVFMAALLTHLIWAAMQQGKLKPTLIALTVIAGLLSLWATARTYRTFQWSVIQQFYAVLTSRNAQEARS